MVNVLVKLLDFKFTSRSIFLIPLFAALWFITLLLFSGAAKGQDYQATISVHDPVVIQEGDTFYLFCTGNGIAVWSSPDLKQWRREDPVFSQAPAWAKEINERFRNHIWAPDITFRDGQYYLYYSVSAFGKNTSAIGLAVNKTLDKNSPNFNWEDKGIVVRSIPGRDLWNAIDPAIAYDASDRPWMSFGSFWEGIKLVRLEEGLAKTGSGPSDWYTIAKRERNANVDDRSAGNAAIEAPFIFKKNGQYYLFVSFDYCCRGANSTYKVVVGRSEQIEGPYLDRDGKSMLEGGGTLVVAGNERWQGVGHNSVYNFQGTDIMLMHGYDGQDEGRSKLLVRQVQWDEGGWPSVDLEE